jgi:hypothetical protein
MRRRGGRGTGDESPPDPTKGPHRWKASRIITSRRSSRAGGHGGLGGSFTLANERYGPAKVGLGASGRRRGDRDVRGSVDRGRRGKKTPTLVAAAGQQPAKHEAKGQHNSNSECCVLDDPPKRSERRENARSSGQAARSPNSGRRPRGESRGRLPEAYEVRVHAVRSGGRSRSDASRVLPAGRSQVLAAKKYGRALARRKLEAPLTRSTGG